MHLWVPWGHHLSRTLKNTLIAGLYRKAVQAYDIFYLYPVILLSLKCIQITNFQLEIIQKKKINK